MEIRKKTILAIDDNSDNLVTLKALISELFPDFDFIKADNGTSGIALAEKSEPDIILLDIIMPGLDGYEVCQSLKSNPLLKDIPVVFLTALKGEKESRIRALECGAEAFLSKPIDISELTAQIRAMIKIREANIAKLDEQNILKKLVQERTAELTEELKKHVETEKSLIIAMQRAQKSEVELMALNEKYLFTIEELRHLNNELTFAWEKAEEGDRLKSAFLTNMSHEIRTPLNGILGFADILIEGQLMESDVIKYSKIIHKSGTRLLELINNIIQISKIESGVEHLQLATFSAADLISDAIEQFMERADKQSIKFKTVIPEKHKDLITVSDTLKLHQILTNLINNALKFTKEGSIEIGYNVNDLMLEFFVKDTGKGIEPEHLDRIFERFYQADISTTRGFEGAGLGLSLCKSIIELLGGSIRAESEPEAGSTFYFSIPLTESDLKS